MTDSALSVGQILEFLVFGTPAPQGSKKGFVNQATGRVNIVEDSSRVKPWREAVKTAALDARRGLFGGDLKPKFAGPVRVTINFKLNRPKGHFGTGRNAGTIKASAPTYPAVKPDLDKLARSTLDALKEASVYGDDSQVVRLECTKRYAYDRESAGARVLIEEVF